MIYIKNNCGIIFMAKTFQQQMKRYIFPYPWIWQELREAFLCGGRVGFPAVHELIAAAGRFF